MKLTDTLDQILRMLLTTNTTSAPATGSSAGNGSPAPEPGRAEPEQTAAGEPEAAAAAHEPEPPPPSPEPDASGTAMATRAEPPADTEEAVDGRSETDGTDLTRLETTADVVERLGLGFHLGSAIDRIATAAGEGSEGVPHLREATWLIERYLDLLERRPVGADLHLTMMRLAREGDTIAGLQALAAALEAEPARALPSPPSPEPAEQAPSADATPTAAEPEAPLPPLRREVFLLAAKAATVILAVAAVVVLLTFIPQLH